jgi:hypothetical protein
LSVSLDYLPSTENPVVISDRIVDNLTYSIVDFRSNSIGKLSSCLNRLWMDKTYSFTPYYVNILSSKFISYYDVDGDLNVSSIPERNFPPLIIGTKFLDLATDAILCNPEMLVLFSDLSVDFLLVKNAAANQRKLRSNYFKHLVNAIECNPKEITLKIDSACLLPNYQSWNFLEWVAYIIVYVDIYYSHDSSKNIKFVTSSLKKIQIDFLDFIGIPASRLILLDDVPSAQFTNLFIAAQDGFGLPIFQALREDWLDIELTKRIKISRGSSKFLLIGKNHSDISRELTSNLVSKGWNLIDVTVKNPIEVITDIRNADLITIFDPSLAPWLIFSSPTCSVQELQFISQFKPTEIYRYCQCKSLSYAVLVVNPLTKNHFNKSCVEIIFSSAVNLLNSNVDTYMN